MGLRERLQGRPRPTAECTVAVVDTRRAERELQEATAALQLLMLSGESQALAQARERVETAGGALERCFETIVCTALPPQEFEDLVDAHPPRKDHPDDDAWNTATFPKACFLACAPADLSADEWEEWLAAQANDGEQILLYNTAIAANIRTPDPSVPKDWTQILS